MGVGHSRHINKGHLFWFLKKRVIPAWWWRPISALDAGALCPGSAALWKNAVYRASGQWLTLYGLTTVMLYFVAPEALQPLQRAGAGFFLRCAAVLFAVHPIHTEVVANIKGQDEIVALLGSLVLCSIRFRYIGKINRG